MAQEMQVITLKEHLKNWGLKGCPINNSLKIFQQKFALNIIRNMMMLKQTKFSQFLGSIEGINTKTLSIRLKELEEFGLIERKVTQQRPLQVEYSLTKKGKALDPILALMAEFSFQYEPEKIFKDKKPRHVKQYFGTEYLSEVYD
ncbi:helix-turn-helix domain-containing protein [Nitrosopumilus sp.]|uniref:winged helix-turn-helix transcriptional regulator n=1 Tax=Nitrosopumilus sp. TaxID=2024843 RepID=UPI0029315B93|nr:helix-turn-helix domain-containing protein [Nitrosopumilus sp.]